jgi:membrane fusion protein, copper/silver efflux system
MTSATSLLAGLLLLAGCARKNDSSPALHAGDLRVQLRLDPDPPRAADNLLHVELMDARGKPVDGVPAREGAPQTLELTPERQQLIGVVYAKVERRPLSLTLRASGRVDVDETQVSDVVLKYDAYVERLFVNQTGQRVRKGAPLLTLYSPELLSAEQDYLVALRSRGVPGSEQLASAAEERLRLWNLGDAQLGALRNRGNPEPRVTIQSPADGTVLEKNIVAGTKAMAGAVLYRIGNLGRIWIIADLFESDAPYVAPGLPATFTLPFAGGAALKGTVQFIDPTVDEKTRSVRARLIFPNARLSLRPGMFGDVKLEVPLGLRLSVPDDALLASGEHRYAFVKRGVGELQVREVKIGALGDYDEVIEGLREGEEVATQATFLLSSEALLRSALPRWSSP